MKKVFIYLVLSIALFAQDIKELSVGSVVIASTSIYKSKDSETQIFPLATMQYKRLYIEGTEVGFYLIEKGDYSVSFEISPNTLGYKGDTTFLQGMKEKKASVDSGLKLKGSLYNGEVTLQVLKDTLNYYNGYTYNLQYEKPKVLNQKNILVTYINFSLFDKKKSDYYFGVSKDESKVDREEYSMDNSHITSVGIKNLYMFSEKVFILSNLEYLKLDNNIYSSPIVDKKDSFSSYLGFLYKIY